MSDRTLEPALPSLAARLAAEIELSGAAPTETCNAVVELAIGVIRRTIPQGGRRQAMAFLTQMMCDGVKGDR